MINSCRQITPIVSPKDLFKIPTTPNELYNKNKVEFMEKQLQWKAEFDKLTILRKEIKKNMFMFPKGSIGWNSCDKFQKVIKKRINELYRQINDIK